MHMHSVHIGCICFPCIFSAFALSASSMFLHPRCTKCTHNANALICIKCTLKIFWDIRTGCSQNAVHSVRTEDTHLGLQCYQSKQLTILIAIIRIKIAMMCTLRLYNFNMTQLINTCQSLRLRIQEKYLRRIPLTLPVP